MSRGTPWHSAQRIQLRSSLPVDLTRTVLESMIEDGEYFFFSVGPDRGITAFREDMGPHALAGLRNNLGRIRRSTTTGRQYEAALAEFRRSPDPPGRMLGWTGKLQQGT